MPLTITSIVPNPGPAGAVTINGTGFDAGAVTVNFGGSPATGITVVSPTQITATAPAHADGVVQVVAATTSNSFAFTYQAPTPPPSTAPTFGAAGAVLAGSNSATAGIPVPPGMVAGKGALAVLYVESGVQAVTPPVGFVEAPFSPVVATGTWGHAIHIYEHVAQGAESGTYPFTIAAGLSWRGGFAVRIDGVPTSGSIFDACNSAAKLTVTNGTYPPVSVDTSGPDRLLVWVGGNTTGGNTTPPAGFTERLDDVGTEIATKSQATQGNSGSLTATVSANSKTTAWVGAILPAGAVVPPAAPTITSIVPNPGPAGAVTINGTGFTAPATVSFGSAAATSVVVVSPAKITCVAPAHADGVVQVAVTTGAGTSNNFAFTYQAPSGAPVPLGIPGNWHLAFEETWESGVLDRTKWTQCWHEGSTNCQTQNNVATDPANISIVNGTLRLKLSSPTVGASVTTNSWYGGPNPGFFYYEGVVEFRIFVPGNGSKMYNWPAFWTPGNSWPSNGENDVFEVLSGNGTTNHHGPSAGDPFTDDDSGITVPGYWGDAWHIVSVHRKANNTSDIYWDGVLRWSHSVREIVLDCPQYIVINIGNGQGNPVLVGDAGAIQCDYVRAWTPA